MGKTTIEWTDASWNPVTGCNEVSPGCANCYAARLAATRLKNVPAYKGLAILRTPQLGDAMHTGELGEERKPRWTGEVRLHPDRLEEPLHWRKPRKIFVCDMSDLFHEKVETTWLLAIFAVMERCPQHTFQILTKRADRMRTFIQRNPGSWEYTTRAPKPKGLPNVWLGVSVENQHFADVRIPLLLDTPASVRFISAEPLLGPVNLTHLLSPKHPDIPIHALKCVVPPHLDWVICGGESGPGARAMHPDWARSLRDQCQSAGVPFFFKQWGDSVPCDQITTEELIGYTRHGRKQPTKSCGNFCCREHGHIEHGELMRVHAGKKKSGRLLDGRTWDEFPNQLR